jgi:hypothetical protein
LSRCHGRNGQQVNDHENLSHPKCPPAPIMSK